ncbi:MAG: hypothetical protein LQ347_002731, partial [Umbilicaria vellea]
MAQYPTPDHSLYPQQQGYGLSPPVGQYPPPSQSPYPEQQGYGLPFLQVQYPPPGNPPHGGAYGQLPPPGYPPQGYSLPALHQQEHSMPAPAQYPPQQAYIQYGVAPPHCPPPSYGVLQPPYGAPSTMLTSPSPGYVPGQMTHAGQFDVAADADALRMATKGVEGVKCDGAALILILKRQTPLQIPLLKHNYYQRYHRSLQSDVAGATSGGFRATLLSILQGPLHQDVHNLHRALQGAGTNEALLNDVLLARSNADLHAIKAAYEQTFSRVLASDVAADLSGKTAGLFDMILAGTRQEDSEPVLARQTEADVTDLHRVTDACLGTHTLFVCAILASRNDAALRAIALAYEAKYRIPLETMLQKEFVGHMRSALLQMVRAATDRAMRDAVNLEDSMKGLGTREELLVARVVRA